MGVSSYNGRVWYNVITDEAPMYPNQSRIVADGVYAEFQTMLAAARKQLSEQEMSEKQTV